jgi:hypothetical protein
VTIIKKLGTGVLVIRHTRRLVPTQAKVGGDWSQARVAVTAQELVGL